MATQCFSLAISCVLEIRLSEPKGHKHNCKSACIKPFSSIDYQIFISLLKSTRSAEIFTIVHCQRHYRTSYNKTLATCFCCCSEANWYYCNTRYTTLKLRHSVLKSFCHSNSSYFPVLERGEKKGWKWKRFANYAAWLFRNSGVGKMDSYFVVNILFENCILKTAMNTLQFI
jgi:hypothetical protein